MKKRPVYSEDKKAQFELFMEFNEQNPARIMRQINRFVNTEFTKFMKDNGYENLTSRHLSVFDSLDLSGSNIVVLARRANITKQGMSKLVKELRLNELVWTVVNPDDTRVLWVYPTNKAIDLMDEYKMLLEENNSKRAENQYFSTNQSEKTIEYLNYWLKSYSDNKSVEVLESLEV
jgi:DNA-binding MarR family transcriptional regulator